VNSDALLSLEGVSRHFQSGMDTVKVLDGVDLELAAGQRLAIMGASGSGKSTLLHLAAGMDRPDAGTITLAGQALDGLREPALTRFRARRVGLVFQDFNLVESLTVYDNIALVPWLTGLQTDQEAIEALCDSLGIARLMNRFPAQLSGGEKQRAAIARALIHRPALILADEPTGSLDPYSADIVLDLFDQSVRALDCAVLMVTHNQDAAGRMDDTLHLTHGQLAATR
jgi:putative ABC transport system ATP-binding protein